VTNTQTDWMLASHTLQLAMLSLNCTYRPS